MGYMVKTLRCTDFPDQPGMDVEKLKTRFQLRQTLRLLEMGHAFVLKARARSIRNQPPWNNSHVFIDFQPQVPPDSYYADSSLLGRRYLPWAYRMCGGRTCLPVYRPYRFFDPGSYDLSDTERQINKYLDKHLPQSLWDLKRNLSKKNHEENVRRRYSTTLHQVFYRESVFSDDEGSLEFEAPQFWLPSPEISVDTHLQVDASPSSQPKNIHPQASQAFSPKGNGTTASRKPTTLPQRK